VTERKTGRDGKKYLVSHDPEEHQRLIAMAHNMHCGQGLSYRETQRHMREGFGVERSLGQLSADLREYQCPRCAVPGGTGPPPPPEPPREPRTRRSRYVPPPNLADGLLPHA
jgi:hypothetical protein